MPSEGREDGPPTGLFRPIRQALDPAIPFADRPEIGTLQCQRNRLEEPNSDRGCRERTDERRLPDKCLDLWMKSRHPGREWLNAASFEACVSDLRMPGAFHPGVASRRF